MPHVTLDIITGVRAGRPTKHRAGFADASVKGALAKALADLDKEFLIALADAPLALDRFTFDFGLSDLTPRGIVAAHWIDAVQELHSIVSITEQSTDRLVRKWQER